MTATTAGALKALIEGAGLGLAAYRDTAPDGEPRPYVTIDEAISIVPERHGDLTAPGAAVAVTELVQVNLWQRAKGTVAGTVYDGRSTDPTEDHELAGALVLALHGAQPATGPTLVYAVTVDVVVRFVERERRVVHHAITVRVRRSADPSSI